ncbi:MAG: hypothetical protein GF349_04795 [Candidatus Magasanikbacteria bacterium]|nr:hypothetical protein [Candidatus Magasanikbacteria bacterium]
MNPKNKHIVSIYAPEVIELAKKAAKEIKAGKKDPLKIQFGIESGYFYLSGDPKKLVNPYLIDVQGESYYIGTFLSEKY